MFYLTINMIHLWFSGVAHTIKDHGDGQKEGRKEMFYLTMHSTHFILRFYGVRHMVKDHSDIER